MTRASITYADLISERVHKHFWEIIKSADLEESIVECSYDYTSFSLYIQRLLQLLVVEAFVQGKSVMWQQISTKMFEMNIDAPRYDTEILNNISSRVAEIESSMDSVFPSKKAEEKPKKWKRLIRFLRS
jgi:hypothetical protein